MNVEELPDPLTEAFEDPAELLDSTLTNLGVAAIGAAIGMRIVASHIAADVCGSTSGNVYSCSGEVFAIANPLIILLAVFGGAAILGGILVSQKWGEQ